MFGTEYKPLTVYVAASYRHMNAVHLLYKAIRNICPAVVFLDWTAKAKPPEGLDAMARRAWMDSDHEVCGKSVYGFCRDSCGSADLLIYYGESGQDVGVEVGIALASGVEVIGIAGPLESPGLMLNGAVCVWADDVNHLLVLVRKRIKQKQETDGSGCGSCHMFGCSAEAALSFQGTVNVSE